MILRSKYHKELAKLQKKFHKVTNTQKKWFYETVFPKQGIYSRKRIYCAECGGWHYSKGAEEDMSFMPIECPHCKLELKVEHLSKISMNLNEYTMIIDTYHEWQVIRLITVRKFIKKGLPVRYHTSEVMQHWISAKGKCTSFSKKCMGQSMYYDQWCHWADLEIRGFNQNRFNLYAEQDWIYPKMKVIPEVARNGFVDTFFDTAPQRAVIAILTQPKAETLMKTKQDALLRYWIHHWKGEQNINAYWSSVKICIRSNYIVENGEDWFDHLNLLEHFNLDVQNRKYICPADFHKAHQHLIKKNMRKELKEKYAKLAKKIKTSQKLYHKQKSPYFGVVIQSGDLRIEPMKSVKEFMEEGMEFGHCIFSNEYYKTASALFLSARILGERVETIELSLIDFHVTQARGYNNKPSKYHNQIIDLVEKNVREIVNIKRNRIKNGNTPAIIK